VVLLHGYSDAWRSWDLVLAHLPEYVHAYALTQRGTPTDQRTATARRISRPTRRRSWTPSDWRRR
jgi:hypothetical protein